MFAAGSLSVFAAGSLSVLTPPPGSSSVQLAALLCEEVGGGGSNVAHCAGEWPLQARTRTIVLPLRT